MPAFDAAATLAAALRSIQRQSFTDWECIVVDDGSRDGTLELARQFERDDARVRVLPRPHAGIVESLRAGSEACRAPLVARFDADDLMVRERLARQWQAFQAERSLSALGSHVRLFPRRSLREGRLAYERWLASIASPEDVAREAFVECPIAHPTLMIRRDVLLAFGYRDQGWPEDYDLVLRLLQAGQRVSVLPQRLLHWRDGASRLSRTSQMYAIAAFVRCKASFLAAGFLAQGERYLLWGYGGTGKALAAALAVHGKHPAAIVELHPRRIGQLIRGVSVVPPSLLPSLERLPIVVSVAGLVARAEIRAALAGMGFEELRDYVCAA